MIVWGGESVSTSVAVSFLNDGSRYNPAGNFWTSITTEGAPAARAGLTASWTGTEMLIWGGGNSTSNFSDTFAYTAPKLVYLYQKP